MARRASTTALLRARNSGSLFSDLRMKLALFHGGVHAFEGLGEAGFERGPTPGSFSDQGDELFVTGGFELGSDLTEFGREPVLRDPFLLENRKLGLCCEDVILFGSTGALWT